VDSVLSGGHCIKCCVNTLSLSYSSKSWSWYVIICWSLILVLLQTCIYWCYETGNHTDQTYVSRCV